MTIFLSFFFSGTATSPAAINGAPNMLSPTVTSFPVPQANSQAPEVYANGIPHYPGIFTYSPKLKSCQYFKQVILFMWQIHLAFEMSSKENLCLASTLQKIYVSILIERLDLWIL